MKKLILLAAIAVGAFASCKKDNVTGPASKKLSASELALLACTNKPPTATDVYIAGEQPLKSNPFIQVAGYWKNGTFIPIADTTTSSSSGYSIAVYGNDVYLCGAAVPPGGHYAKAVYWKNGVAHFLDYGSSTGEVVSSANDIAVAGNDVYVIGDYNFSSGIIWKNGVPHNLDYSGYHTGARGLAVKGSDVYVSGYSSVGNTAYTTATLWKNGVPTRLTNCGLSWASLYALTIDGCDVYVAGMTYPEPNALQTAVYWKNGVKHFLGDNALVSDIIINNGNAYVIGTQIFGTGDLITQATYWKINTQTFSKSQTFFGIKSNELYEGRQIAVAGNDIYMTAFQNPDFYFYKNNVPTKLAVSDGGYGKMIIVQH